MRVKKCRYCQTNIPSGARTCPYCGKRLWSQAVVTAVIVVVLLIALGGLYRALETPAAKGPASEGAQGLCAEADIPEQAAAFCKDVGETAYLVSNGQRLGVIAGVASSDGKDSYAYIIEERDGERFLQPTWEVRAQ